MDWTARANAIAQFHFEEEFDQRLIVDELAAEQVVYFWNNKPAKASITLRDVQVESIRQECAHVGMRQLAFVEYPRQGRDEGYSCLAIFEVPEEDSPSQRCQWLARLCREVFSQPIERD